MKGSNMVPVALEGQPMGGGLAVLSDSVQPHGKTHHTGPRDVWRTGGSL